MNPINRVGQKVLCVGDERVWLVLVCPGLKHFPKRGEIYTVSAFETFQTMACIHLREIPGLTCECQSISGAPWLISAFKPLDERSTDISDLRSLLNPAPETVDA